VALRHVALPDPYDPESGPSLLYSDCTNLYGHAMMEPLPVSEYTWLGEDELASMNWEQQARDQDYGYIVEADLAYPPWLHEGHDALPLAPEHVSYSAARPPTRSLAHSLAHFLLDDDRLFDAFALLSKLSPVLSPQRL
jgi:hypothetical protein